MISKLKSDAKKNICIFCFVFLNSICTYKMQKKILSLFNFKYFINVLDKFLLCVCALIGKVTASWHGPKSACKFQNCKSFAKILHREIFFYICNSIFCKKICTSDHVKRPLVFGWICDAFSDRPNFRFGRTSAELSDKQWVL